MKKSLFTLFLLLTAACPILAKTLVAELTLNDDESTYTLTFKAVDETPTYVIEGEGMYAIGLSNYNNYNGGMYSDSGSKITKAVLDASMKDVKPTKTAYWFYNLSAITSIENLEYLDTSEATDMQYMFRGCNNLTSLDVTNFNTSKVTNMSYMFYECKKLPSLNVTNFDTQNVTDMSYMFYGCFALTSLDVTKFNTSKVTNMQGMFDNCQALTTLNVTKFDTQNVTDMSGMFESCYKLKALDVTQFNTSNVTNMSGMFWGCREVTTLNVTKFDTQKVTNMSYMFYDCYVLASLDVTKFNTSNVTDMQWMFADCRVLKTLDVTKFDTQKVTNMSYMFYDCYALTSLDVTKFNTSNVTKMQWMFNSCMALKKIDVTKFNTSKVTDMSYMFVSCNSLTTLDLSNFDFSSNPDVSVMATSTNLKEVNLGSNDISKTTHYNRYIGNAFNGLATRNGNVTTPVHLTRTFDRASLGSVYSGSAQMPPYYRYCGGYFTIADTLNCNTDYTPKVNADADLWQSNRTLKANVWNTLVLPAGLTKAQVTQSLGSDVELCYMDSFDGKALSFKTFTDSDFPTKANTPVLVKPTREIKYLAYINVSVVAPDNDLTVTTEPVNGYTASFIGSYLKTMNLGREGYYYYDGQFLHSAGNSTVNNTRGYFTFSGPTDNGAAKRFVLDDGGTVTAIDNINGEPASANAPAYNLAGQRVGSDYKGIVIIGGKKTIRK